MGSEMCIRDSPIPHLTTTMSPQAPKLGQEAPALPVHDAGHTTMHNRVDCSDLDASQPSRDRGRLREKADHTIFFRECQYHHPFWEKHFPLFPPYTPCHLTATNIAKGPPYQPPLSPTAADCRQLTGSFHFLRNAITTANISTSFHNHHQLPLYTH